MGEKEELNREEARLMVKKQQLIELRKEIPPKVGERWDFTQESLDENEKLDKEIEEVDIKLKEIKAKLSAYNSRK